MNVGMKIFGQIVNILPLALIVSLPNQLYGHVPITNISSQLTELLERLDAQELRSNDEEVEENEDSRPSHTPELSDLFTVGQYVRAVVSAVHAPGTSDVLGVGRSRDENIKTSRRVELSLIPERVNTGVSRSDLKQGFVRCPTSHIHDCQFPFM
jgi:rRNA biogenesis protein RRP5